MRFWFTILSSATLLAGGGMLVSATRAHTSNPEAAAEAAPVSAKSAWDFNLTAIDGKPLPMEQFRGKVVLLVNTASMCGFTPQYDGLEKLQRELGPKGFTVVGVPSGDFLNQEYDDNGKIKDFCETHFGISFPLAEKSHVKGSKALPIYRWAKENLASNNEPKWNFHKFLIGRDGQLIAGFPTKTAPDNPGLQSTIAKALQQ